MVRRRAGLHADQAWRKIAEVVEHLRPAKAHLGDAATLGIRRVNLETCLAMSRPIMLICMGSLRDELLKGEIFYSLAGPRC